MATHCWKDLKKATFSTEQIARIDGEVRDELIAMDLRALREASEKTQTELAELTKMTQSELSKIERRDDHLLSTLRTYVGALGGTLEVAAVINGRRIILEGV